IDSAEASTTTGQPGWGTPAYMAPEQREGHSATYASDIFALGVVMQEMVIGRSSFPLQPQEVLDPRWPSAIRRCLDRDRSARFGTTHELVQALEGSTRMTWALAPVVLAVLVVSAIVLARSGLIPDRADMFAIRGTVALLPFTETNAASENQAFSRGLVSVLTEQLQRAAQPGRRLWIVPAAEVIDAELRTPATAHRVLGVDIILTGHVDRQANRIAMTVSLVKTTPTGAAPVETQTFELGNQIILPSVLTSLAHLVDVKLPPPVLQTLTAGGTARPDAEAHYLRGRGFLAVRQGDVDAAIDALQRAIQLGGNYAVAHAALSEAYLRKYSITLDPGWIPRAQASADAAIALDPSLPYAHAVRGLFYRTTGQHER